VGAQRFEGRGLEGGEVRAAGGVERDTVSLAKVFDRSAEAPEDTEDHGVCSSRNSRSSVVSSVRLGVLGRADAVPLHPAVIHPLASSAY
jgi:hypothetical protein